MVTPIEALKKCIYLCVYIRKLLKHLFRAHKTFVLSRKSPSAARHKDFYTSYMDFFLSERKMMVGTVIDFNGVHVFYLMTYDVE